MKSIINNEVLSMMSKIEESIGVWTGCDWTQLYSYEITIGDRYYEFFVDASEPHQPVYSELSSPHGDSENLTQQSSNKAAYEGAVFGATEYREQCEKDAADAEEKAKEAIYHLVLGDYAAADEAIEIAKSIEQQYGDCSIWGRFGGFLETFSKEEI